MVRAPITTFAMTFCSCRADSVLHATLSVARLANVTSDYTRQNLCLVFTPCAISPKLTTPFNRCDMIVQTSAFWYVFIPEIFSAAKLDDSSFTTGACSDYEQLTPPLHP